MRAHEYFLNVWKKKVLLRELENWYMSREGHNHAIDRLQQQKISKKVNQRNFEFGNWSEGESDVEFSRVSHE